MGYFFRVFCTAEEPPALSAVLAWVRERGVTLRIEARDVPGGFDTTRWGDAPIPVHYGESGPAFTVELNRCEGDDSLCAQETGEFLRLVEPLRKSRKRDRVLDQLRNTRFIVACEIPVAGFPDPGFHALDVLMAYFLVHSNGMVQADGQGFYEMGKVIVEVAA